MAEQLWSAVDDYLSEVAVRPDPSYAATYQASVAAGLPDIAVSAAEGKQLHLLARMRGAKRILEIGTLGGYSTLWLARALPDGGKLISLEYDAHHADVARENLSKAGVGEKVEIIVGPALETLPKLEGAFDFFFVDANKDGYPDYFRWALKLAAPGAVLVADNMVRQGKVADATSDDPSVIGVRAALEVARAEPRVSATAIQTVGARGHDGYLLAIID
ncbi:putative O-methyltransferase YrrM [Rhizomicrobium palustre]|uniref:Putative O-methyltransferase YrrM n=1 Tax=Rhizomicrobium palustre TaxID=189966 RepID=A0A846N0T9_9PROT|nr:O-methyltransferase [Rhizomicrobium palustre]NIK89574.1 putative O-methyltransferase YrrM [Rhizomicrobium palustre]